MASADASMTDRTALVACSPFKAKVWSTSFNEAAGRAPDRIAGAALSSFLRFWPLGEGGVGASTSMISTPGLSSSWLSSSMAMTSARPVVGVATGSS